MAKKSSETDEIRGIVRVMARAVLVGNLVTARAFRPVSRSYSARECRLLGRCFGRAQRRYRGVPRATDVMFGD